MQLGMEVHSGIVVLGILQHTVLEVVVTADEVVDVLRAAAHRDGVIGLSGPVLRTFIHPVGGSELLPTAIVVVGVVVEVGIGHPGGLLLIPFVRTACIISANVDPLLLFPCRQTLRHVARHIDGIIAVVGDLRTSFAAALGSDEHYARGSTCTIDGTGRGILQHRDALDVVGIEQGNVSLDAIDQHQGRSGIHRRETADTHAAGLAAWFTARTEHSHTRHFSLHGAEHVARRLGSQLVSIDGTHGTRQVNFLLNTVANDHDLVQGLIIFLEKYRGTNSRGQDLLGSIANIREDERCTRPYILD